MLNRKSYKNSVDTQIFIEIEGGVFEKSHFKN